MTVDVAGRRSRRTTKAATSPEVHAPESISIGEIEQTVFSCPNCQRPLALGAKRCPGCRTHLVMGVVLSKASMLVAVGLAIGLAVGGAAGGMALLSSGATRDSEIAAAVSAALAAAKAQPVPVATSAPVDDDQPVATVKPGGGSTGIPSLAQSAMTQSATVNANLAAAVPVLQAALAARDFDTYTVSETLRSLSGDAVVGRQLAGHIGAWSGGAELSASLAAYYTSVQQTAAEGLDASIRNEAAYKTAAVQMLKLLGGLDALDTQLRTVASDAGLTIPPPEAP